MDQRWLDYLYEFHVTRDYHRCHDFLEAWWFELNNPQDHLLMAFIQLAIAQYHWRAENLIGAQLLYEKALRIFTLNQEKISDYGLDKDALLNILKQAQINIETNQAFVEINLPMVEENILFQLTQKAKLNHQKLYADSDLSNHHLVHRHKYK